MSSSSFPLGRSNNLIVSSVKLGTEQEGAALQLLQLLSPLDTWQEVTPHSIYGNIQRLHAEGYGMQLELLKRTKRLLTWSTPLPCWLPPCTAHTSACRSLRSETKRRIFSSKNETWLRSYPGTGLSSIINNHFQQQTAYSVQRTHQKMLKSCFSSMHQGHISPIPASLCKGKERGKGHQTQPQLWSFHVTT